MPEGSPPSPFRYLVEWYQPALSAALLEETQRQLGRSAAEVSQEGTAVSLLMTLFVPDDEVAFCLFAAGSPTSVEQTCRRAALPFERISRAITGPDATRAGSAPGQTPADLAADGPGPAEGI
jgi:Protein of unknown function (DUF4242)